MTTIPVAFASDVVDRFEELALKHGISIPRHPQTSSDMLPFWEILKFLRDTARPDPSDRRPEYTAAVAVHDLAAKVLEVSKSPQFEKLIPHLKQLAGGAIHLTETPPPTADVYNKLIELYWACLCIGAGADVDLDDPEHSTGKNPDVISCAPDGSWRHGYAFKTVRSAHTQSILEHIRKGIDQIEVSDARSGIVVLHLTPRFQSNLFWPNDGYFLSWTHPAIYLTSSMRTMVSQVVQDNGQSALDSMFVGKKAVQAVLCIAFAATVAAHPATNRPMVMPLKVPVLVTLGETVAIPPALQAEILAANDLMQTVLG